MRRVQDLLGLGAWAAAALTVCNGFSPAAMERALGTVTGSAALGWLSTRRLVHAAVIADRARAAIAALAHRGLSAVLSSRIPT
jgi:hypothetical protein